MASETTVLRGWILEHGDEDVLIADGFDHAVIGLADRCGMGPVLVYDVDKILASLCGEGLTYEEATEHFEFNIRGAYVGERTPLFLYAREKA